MPAGPLCSVRYVYIRVHGFARVEPMRQSKRTTLSRKQLHSGRIRVSVSGDLGDVVEQLMRYGVALRAIDVLMCKAGNPERQVCHRSTVNDIFPPEEALHLPCSYAFNAHGQHYLLQGKGAGVVDAAFTSVTGTRTNCSVVLSTCDMHPANITSISRINTGGERSNSWITSLFGTLCTDAPVSTCPSSPPPMGGNFIKTAAAATRRSYTTKPHILYSGVIPRSWKQARMTTAVVSLSSSRESSSREPKTLHSV